MKAGVYTVILCSLPFEKALDYTASVGFQAVEIGVGAWAGTAVDISDNADGRAGK